MRFAFAFFLCGAALAAGAEDIFDRVEHGYADNAGVKIHYAKTGSGPLIVFVHGFPDFWYSWRHQMEALSDAYTCVAMDQRGYNLSDKPAGQENYDAAKLATDVQAVIRANGQEKAIVVGHDWGGFVAWSLAMTAPEMVTKLVICNLPHPKGLSRELAHNPEQQENSAYARAFQAEGAEKLLNATTLAYMISKGDKAVFDRYNEAFKLSDKKAMLDYYKQNYPREPYMEDTREFPAVAMPVLMFHGLKDKALHRNALSGTWDWVSNSLTIVTIPDADHWVHHDAAAYVSATMRDWLARN